MPAAGDDPNGPLGLNMNTGSLQDVMNVANQSFALGKPRSSLERHVKTFHYSWWLDNRTHSPPGEVLEAHAFQAGIWFSNVKF